MSESRPLRAKLIEREANGGPGVLPARVRPATSGLVSAAFVETRYSKFKLERESIVQNAPAASGVYGLFNVFWIYVGEANDIRARLLEHLAGNNGAWFERYRPSGFAFETVAPALRERRYLELMEALEPLCDTLQPACPKILERAS